MAAIAVGCVGFVHGLLDMMTEIELMVLRLRRYAVKVYELLIDAVCAALIW